MNGKTLRIIRIHLDLTQEEMADKMGVTTNTIARWERDEVPINETAIKLALTFLDTDGMRKVLAS